MHTEAFERAVATVEEAVDACRRQTMSASQYGWTAVDALLAYLDDEDPRDDVELFISYAVDWADALGEVSLFADQTLAAVTERRLRWCLQRQSLRFRYDQLLTELARGLNKSDHAAVVRIASLCANGASHRMFQPLHWGGELIDLAARHRLTGALFEALRPSAPSRLAHWHRDGGRTYLRALDHLAHLAADPIDADGTAEAARDRLVDLGRFFSTAADAAIRLPVHLVTDAQFDRLLGHYERRATYYREMADDEAAAPSEQAERDTAVFRGVLFQIKDADRMRDLLVPTA